MTHPFREGSHLVERMKGQRYGKKFRGRAVERMNACDNSVALAHEFGVGRRLLLAGVPALPTLVWRARIWQRRVWGRRSRHLSKA